MAEGIDEDFGICCCCHDDCRRRPCPGGRDGRHPSCGPGNTGDARALAAEGFAVLSVSYYRLPGQPEVLMHIPLETFSIALEWLNDRPRVDGDRIAIVGAFTGAEAALLVAQPDAVVAGMPSSVAWQGMSWKGEVKGSSWTKAGEPVPYVSYASDLPFENLGELYANSLSRLGKHADAIIPVEAISGSVLLICGEADSVWPSCPMARQVAERARSHQGASQVTILACKDADHAVYKPPLKDENSQGLDFLGGSDEGNAKARADGWPKVIAYLRETLGAQ